MKRHEDYDMLLRMEAGGTHFAYCPGIAGVRACDLRPDRLSTLPVQKMLDHFLNSNINRMTARAVVMWEAIQWGAGHQGSPDLPLWLRLFKRQVEQIKYILRTPRLEFGHKVWLVGEYVTIRVRHKVFDQVFGKPAEF